MAKTSRTQYGTDSNDDMNGTALDDTIYSGAGNDYVWAGNGNDRLYGGLGNDVLFGGLGNDSLFGGDGNDILLGEAGNNIVVGGYGSDKFVLRMHETDSARGFIQVQFEGNSFDTIADFVPAVDGLMIGVIGQEYGEMQPLLASAFVSGYGAVAQGLEDRLIYDRSTGNLYWDDNGSADGGSVLVAKLLGVPDLHASDVLIVGFTL